MLLFWFGGFIFCWVVWLSGPVGKNVRSYDGEIESEKLTAEQQTKEDRASRSIEKNYCSDFVTARGRKGVTTSTLSSAVFHVVHVLPHKRISLDNNPIPGQDRCPLGGRQSR